MPSGKGGCSSCIYAYIYICVCVDPLTHTSPRTDLHYIDTNIFSLSRPLLLPARSGRARPWAPARSTGGGP